MYQSQINRTIIFGIAAALFFWSSAMAETAVDTGEQQASFDQLSPGGQKHAKSLFDAQQTGNGGTAMTLDDIALAKQETGWGNVFKQMKEDGLVLEKNFGQIVSGQGKIDAGKTDTTTGAGESTDMNTSTAGAATGHFTRPKRTKLVVTTANGGRVTFGLKKSGSKSRPFAKGSGAPKALKVSGHGKLSGLTAARRSHGGGKSFGGGKGKTK